MSISLNSDFSSFVSQLQQKSSAEKAGSAAKLEAKLSGDLSNATDEELMDACKSFEAYLTEQVLTNMRDVMTDSEDEEGDYLAMFGDQLYQKYAEQIAENGELGLAQQLYEAMKRDYGMNK